MSSLREYIPRNELGCIVVCVTEIVVDAMESAVDALRKIDPLIRVSLVDPVHALVTKLLADPTLLEGYIRGEKDFLKCSCVTEMHADCSRKNERGETLLATITIAFGTLEVEIECLQAHPAHRLLMSVLSTAKHVPFEREEKACNLLKQHATEEQWHMYRLTGTLIHNDERSRYCYLIRRGFPTLVFEKDEEQPGVLVFKLGLCAHQEGYEPGHFSGFCCPTDDVVAHLLMLRADEDTFWNRAKIHLPVSGLIGL